MDLITGLLLLIANILPMTGHDSILIPASVPPLFSHQAAPTLPDFPTIFD